MQVNQGPMVNNTSRDADGEEGQGGPDIECVQPFQVGENFCVLYVKCEFLSWKTCFLSAELE